MTYTDAYLSILTSKRVSEYQNLAKRWFLTCRTVVCKHISPYPARIVIQILIFLIVFGHERFKTSLIVKTLKISLVSHKFKVWFYYLYLVYHIYQLFKQGNHTWLMFRVSSIFFNNKQSTCDTWSSFLSSSKLGCLYYISL